MKNQGPGDLALGGSQRGLSGSFLDRKIRWSGGAMEPMKSQTPSTKSQTNSKFQYKMTETGFEF